MQMVQPRGVYGVGTGIRGSSHRLAGVGEKVLFSTVLPAALHVPARGIYQGSQLGRAGFEQSNDPGQQSSQLHVPPR